MISYDTFSGPRARVREADLDSKGLIILAEHLTPLPEFFSPRFEASDEFYESQDDDSDSCDLFDENNAIEQDPEQENKQEQASGGRIRQLVQLLTLQSHNVGDARSALVAKLLQVVKVNELLLSRATEEQIADAANDAITNEILESVDQEERRRNELALQEQQLQPVASTLFGPGQLSPFRVLELVDVLDSTTGGMVKRVLKKVRRRAPLNTRMRRDNEMEREVEFCRFCSAYGDHTAAQHRCRLCGVAGHHRSRSCPCRETIGTNTCISDMNLLESSDANADAVVDDQRFCTLCNSWGNHATERHQCRKCGAYGAHRSQSCSSTATTLQADPRQGQSLCTYCNAWRPHASDKHRCRLCGVVGLHRSDVCPQRSSSNTMLSYSVDAASKVRDRVLKKIPQVLPSPAVTLVWRSLDKVGDADLILRKTLQRIGVWGGGSQTPITTPYAPTSVKTSSDGAASSSHDSAMTNERFSELESSPRRVTSAPSSSCISSAVFHLDEGQSSVYVLSYAEGLSVVPARILKYMRLLMHHEVSTNAFSVVVLFDPRQSHWELMKPGMVSPQSLPSSPTLSHQLRKRMSHYTLQTMLGARDKLRELEATRRKFELQMRQEGHFEVKFRDQQKQKDVHHEQHQADIDETRQIVVPVDA